MDGQETTTRDFSPENIFSDDFDAPEGDVVETTENQPDTPQKQDGKPVVTAAPEQKPFNEDRLAEAIAKAQAKAAGQAKAQGQQPAPQMSEAEIRKAINYFEVDGPTFGKVFGMEPEGEQLQAFNQLLQGAVRQAFTMAQYRTQMLLNQGREEFMKEVGPVVSQSKQQHEQGLTTNFYQQNPDLKDYGELVNEVTLAAKAQGKQFPNAEEAFKFVAGRVRALLGKAGQGAAPNQQQQTQPTKHTMPRTAVRGAGNQGSVQKPAAGQKQVTPESLFG